ncbi:dolichyl-diphosphooligosaccharide--protein glycosyltransferase subunit 2 [Caerostris extrusa]|uniref:Dolichyl-diphosphooligosaccharide--protein glycosyltransferase subunit 2 n=1 Tax=Caerostris extrusa TaxID=172846 RepID=A0AAV4XHJ2_CAEEX|nr:dolichyl-diphosphooligosaccharide--protein glycosyltransferase subunit 2 [Caerostris extrusa]
MICTRKTICVVFLLAVFGTACRALTPSTFLTNADQQRLKKILSTAFPLSELVTAHYAVLGYSLLSEKLPEDPCKFFDSKIDKKRLDTIFHASSGAKYVPNCKLTVTGLQQVLDAAISEDSSMQEIYHAVLSLRNLNLKIDSAKVAKVLTATLKRDDSVINLGYAFNVASVLQKDFKSFFERVEDAIVQADEVDGKYLQFEGGLGITATTISGVYRLAEVAKAAPALTADQAVKFTNYFLSRKFVQSVKGAAQLLDVLKIFATNKYHIPVAVTLASNSALSDENPNIQVRITNVLGASLGPLTVTVDSAKRLGDNAVVMSKKAFQAVKGSNILYSLNFMEIKPLRGFYTVSINALPSKADPKLIGNTGAKISVKVMTEVVVESAEIGTSFIDQVSSTKSTSIVYPKESVNFDVDTHQKISLKFSLKDKNAKSQPLIVHQAFIMFTNQKTNQEVVFVIDHDSSGGYKYDLDVKSKEKDFQFASGVYDIYIIIGDPVLKNPFMWKLGQVTFTFSAPAAAPSLHENPYDPKPEIKHMFREKDKTPPSIVSNTFSVLCMAPLLLLFILWIKLGANLSNFPCSLASVGFHLGLLSIFGLFQLRSKSKAIPTQFLTVIHLKRFSFYYNIVLIYFRYQELWTSILTIKVVVLCKNGSK